MAAAAATEQRKATSAEPRFASPRSRDIRGPLRHGKRTKALTPTLAPGSVALLQHGDLDAVAAHALASCRPAAIINTVPSVSGRYPNRGPGVLLDAHIPLFDVCADDERDLFALVADGETVVIRDAQLFRANASEPVARLVQITPERLADQLENARTHLDGELSQFAQNTLRYLDKADERAVLLDPIAVLPSLRISLAGRPVLVVVRGDGYEEDVRRLTPYLHEQKPVVIAVDGAADALLALGVRPHIVLGDMDSISDETLRKSHAELVVHAYPRRSDVSLAPRNGAVVAPGLVRVQALGLSAHVFPVGGTSEDAALLLAYEKGADLIVAVGTHTHLEDFLDKGRGGMASTFLVRLKVGSRLVDARGVSRLYRSRKSNRFGDVGPLLLLLLSALFPLVVLVAQTPQGQIAWRSAAVWFRLLFRIH